MKRLVSLLAALLFSITAGVEFINPKPDDFVLRVSKESSAYWSPGNEDNTSPAALYRLQFGAKDDGTPLCETAPMIPSRITSTGTGWSVTADTSDSTQGPPWWFAITEGDSGCTNIAGAFTDKSYHEITGEEGAATSASWTPTDLEAGKRFYICAPAAGTIETSHYSCDYGQTMNFKYEMPNGTKVIMSVRNAVCWYCCRNKSAETSDTGVEYFTANTKDSLKGKSMSAGALLMIGDVDTTISFTRA